jgi:hypothetical protein
VQRPRESGRGGTGRRRLALVLLALVLPLLLAGPALGESAQQPVAPAVEAAPVRVDVTGLAPRAPQDPDDLVQVTGRLVNLGPTAVRELSVRLLVGDVLISRSALARAAESPRAGRPRGPDGVLDVVALAPGEATGFALAVSVRDLRLGRIGAYPVQVQVRGRLGDDAPAESLGQASTFLPWFPDGPPQPTRVAVLWPLVAEPQRAPDGAMLGPDLLAELGDDGRLTRLLEASRTSVPVTYAVDPELLEAVQALAGEHVVVTGDGGREARAGEPVAQLWLDQLVEALAGTDLVALPYADPDVVAIARSRTGLTADLEQLRVLGRRVAVEITGTEPLEDVVWPPAGPLSSAALDTLTGGDATAVVLDPEALPERAPMSGRTPGTRTRLAATVGGPLDGLVVDDVLSALLTAGPDDDGWQGDRLAEQRWLAETAILAAERPAESRTLLIAPPRRGEVRPGVAREALLDLSRLPWLCPVPLADVVAGTEACPREDPEATPGQLEDRGELQTGDGEGELSPGFLQQVVAVRARAEQLTDEVLIAGTGAAGETKARLLRARGRTLSSTWRDDPAGGRRMLAMQREEVDSLRGQVQLVTSGRVLLTSDTGVVEVLLSNGLDQPVTVGVALNDPVEARLSSSDTGIQTVAPGQQVQVRVRVEARVSGQFVVRATLLDRAGEPFGEPVELVARSTRYGSLALAVTGVAAGVLLVAVGVRLTRRAMAQAARARAGVPDHLS